ncbi:MAG: glycosyltransferase family 4 protein [Nitrososphaerales archaeon]
MKIAVVMPYVYPPTIGGTELLSYYLWKEMAKLGHEIHILTCNRDFSGRKIGTGVSRTSGIVIHRFRSIIPHYGIEFVPNMPIHLLTQNYDLIFTFDSKHIVNFIAVIMGKIKRKPTIIYPYAVSAFEERNILLKIIHPLYSRIMLPLLLRLGVSPAIVDNDNDKKALAALGYTSIMMQPGVGKVEFDQWNILSFRARFNVEDKKVVLYVGRLHHQKGVDVLVKSIQYVAIKYPNVLCLIAGPDVNMRSSLQGMCKELRIENKVIFSGILDEQEKQVAFEVCDCVVIPSLTESENFGIVLSEAWFHAKPVVASKVGGLRLRIENNVNGVLVEPGDPIELSNAIMSILSNENFAKSLGNNGKKGARTYDKIANEFQNYLDTVGHF